MPPFGFVERLKVYFANDLPINEWFLMTFTVKISVDIVRKRQNSRNNLVEKFIAIAWNSIMIQRRNICFNHIAMRNSTNVWVCWSFMALIGFDFVETEFLEPFFGKMKEIFVSVFHEEWKKIVQ